MPMSDSTPFVDCFGSWASSSGSEAVTISSVRMAFRNDSSCNETASTRNRIRFDRSAK